LFVVEVLVVLSDSSIKRHAEEHDAASQKVPVYKFLRRFYTAKLTYFKMIPFVKKSWRTQKKNMTA